MTVCNAGTLMCIRYDLLSPSIMLYMPYIVLGVHNLIHLDNCVCSFAAPHSRLQLTGVLGHWSESCNRTVLI